MSQAFNVAHAVSRSVPHCACARSDVALPSARSAPCLPPLASGPLSEGPTAERPHRAPSPVAALVHELVPPPRLLVLHRAPFSFSLFPSPSLSLSLFLFVIRALARLSLSLALHRFPSSSHISLSVSDAFRSSFFFPHSPSLLRFRQASRFFSLSFLRFLVIPHALTHCGPVTAPRGGKSFPALDSPATPRAYTKGGLPSIRDGCADFPVRTVSCRAVHQPDHLGLYRNCPNR